MKRRPVRSSNIKSIGHDGTTLEVEFRDGSVYQYSGVSANRALALMLSKSKGQHLQEYIIPNHDAKRTRKPR
jgi:hypothetical protein